VDGAVAIVLAAGTGDRLGRETPKAFVPLAGRPLLLRAAQAACASRSVTAIVVVAPPGWEDLAHAVVEPVGAHEVVTGGATRQASVRAALAAIPAGRGVLVCHDAARPLATPGLFDAVLDALEGWDGVVPVVPVADTVKRLRGEAVEGTEAREGLGLAQTPQAFVADALREAHTSAERNRRAVTDDAAALELAGYRVRAIPGEPGNFKITTAEDLARAESILAELERD
jgi:2-C-methyl-D-erythritol 4-phosphate cytidylyltransferase